MQAFYLNTGLAGLYKLLTEKKFAFAGIVYFLISTSILFWFGFNTNGEAAKYIEDAHRILTGEHLSNGFLGLFYIVYSLLISSFIFFFINIKGIAFLQIVLSFAAGCCLYKILMNVTGDKKISFAAFVFYLLCIPIQKWNFFLYTESLHTSFLVAGLYFIYCVFQKEQHTRKWMLLFLLLLILFSRPVGIIFFISFLTVFLWWVFKTKNKFIYYIFLSFFVIGAALLFKTKLTFYFNPDSLRRMEIICQVPQANVTAPYKEYNDEGLSSFFSVITNEIGLKKFMSLGIKKVVSFFGLVRSFYSTPHNIVLLCLAALLYPLATLGLFVINNKKTISIKLFIVTYIFITVVGIFFTCDEWSNRFITPVLPLLILLAGMGLYCLKKKNNSLHNNIPVV